MNIAISLEDCLKQFNIFLLDASGVIYNDMGPIKDIDITISKMQEIGEVFVVTNNSYLYTTHIAKKLKKINITIAPNRIISSGLGLVQDATIHEVLNHKKVYISGYQSSHKYLEKINSITLVKNIQEANVIALTSYQEDPSYEEYNKLHQYLSNNPQTPIVCCNPDQIVRGKNGPHKVVGYYAKKLEITLENPFYWIGKPFQNFNHIVLSILQSHPHFSAHKACFFDDNLKNIQSMENDTQIKGIWVTDTGISYKATIKEKENQAWIPSLSWASFEKQ